MSGSWVNPFGPEALNNLIFFGFEMNATFSCDTVGSRCSFLRDDYAEVDDDGGAIADQLAGSVWTVSDPLVDVLNLRLCTIGLCVPACFNDCNCILPDGTPCGETTRFPTAAPTPVAPTPSPGPKTCAKINGEAACSTLMDPDNIPVGVDCYCYNFCNGSFLSCCNEDQTCSPKVCETGAMVEVNGCVDGDFVSGGMPSPPSPGSPTTNPPSMAYMGQSSPVVAALVTLVLLIQRW